MTGAADRDDLARRMDLAVDIAREAGQLARRALETSGRIEVTVKGSQDWVTNVDLEVENLVRTRLAAAHPDEPFLGEEAGVSQAAAGSGMWVIDPIDGTTCFMLGLPQWCVALGYLVDSQPVVAAIYAPMTEEMFAAHAGGGAFLNGQPIRVADAASTTQGLVAVGISRDADPAKSARFIEALAEDGGMYIRIGACALALAYVAAGRLLAAYEPLVSPWDDLAGMLLVREAGGWTNDYAETALSGRRRPVLAAAPGVWPEVYPLIGRQAHSGAG